MMIINKLEHHVNILNVREHERSLTARLLNKAFRSLGGLCFRQYPTPAKRVEHSYHPTGSVGGRGLRPLLPFATANQVTHPS